MPSLPSDDLILLGLVGSRLLEAQVLLVPTYYDVFLLAVFA